MLCSATKTFAVKNVETTNLVLLVQEEAAGAGGSGGAAAAALASQDPNVQPTPPGAVGLATQLQKVGGGLKGGPQLEIACLERVLQPRRHAAVPMPARAAPPCRTRRRRSAPPWWPRPS